MKSIFKQQQVLKAGLLVALAANMTWEPMKATLQAIDMASKGASEALASQPAAGTSQPAQPLSSSPNALRLDGSQSATTSAQAVAQNAVAPAQPAIGTLSGTIESCPGVKTEIRVTRAANNASATQISVVHGGNRSGGFLIESKLEELIETNSDGKSQLKSEVSKRVHEFIAKDFPACRSGDLHVQAPAAPAQAPANPQADRQRLDEGHRKCENDRIGRPLSEVARIECNNDRLEKLEINPLANRDDARNQMSRLKTDFDSIVRSLKEDLRKLLLSSDESDQEEGKRLADEIIDAIKGAVATNDLARTVSDKNKFDKLEKEIKAMVTGAEVRRESVAKAEEMRQLKKDIAEANKALREGQNLMQQQIRDGSIIDWSGYSPQQQQMIMSNPQLYQNMINQAVNQRMWELQSPLNQLEQQRQQLMMGLQNSLPMDPYTNSRISDPIGYFNRLRTQQILSARDVSEFTGIYAGVRRDYDLLGRSILQARGVNTPGLPTIPGSTLANISNIYDPVSMPANLVSYRQGLAGRSMTPVNGSRPMYNTGGPTLARPTSLNFASSGNFNTFNANLNSGPGAWGMNSPMMNNRPFLTPARSF